ncbi:hypothetical protein ABTX62_33790 [Streptomyces sp. NPDC096046]|uniref:hypothetical protein n=1 Tax=Streptomyces sp. NPDC096046 TaxID=3155542 RepID=UPI0033270B8C
MTWRTTRRASLTAAADTAWHLLTLLRPVPRDELLCRSSRHFTAGNGITSVAATALLYGAGQQASSRKFNRLY